MKYLLIFPATVCFLLSIMIIFSIKSEDKEIIKLKYGRISKVEFEDHSYLVWQKNWSDCILHDQNCKCLKND